MKYFSPGINRFIMSTVNLIGGQKKKPSADVENHSASSPVKEIMVEEILFMLFQWCGRQF